MPRFERYLRLVTGLAIAAYVAGHFLNHALGIFSVEAMDALRRVLSAWWRSLPGTILLYGSLLTHFALALVSLSRRRTLRMPAWEACQLALGLAILPLLAYHVVGTRFAWQLLDREVNYPRIVAAIWSDPWQIAKQIVLIGVAIVGSMGPPAAPIVSAIGDTINSAARLESLTKQFGCTLIVSVDTLRFAGIAPPDVGVQRVEVRGKVEQLEVLTIEDPATLLSGTDDRAVSHISSRSSA